MTFYKITARLNENDFLPDRKSSEEKAAFAVYFCEKSDDFFRKSGKNIFIFLQSINNRTSSMSFGIISKKDINPQHQFKSFSMGLLPPVSSLEAEEITFNTLCSMLFSAARVDFVNDEEKICDEFSLNPVKNRYCNIYYGENLIDPKRDKSGLIATANNLMMRESLATEIERIYTCPAKKKLVGHPVHYLIKSDDLDVRREAWRALLSALYQNGRVKNRRYCYVDFDNDSRQPDGCYDALYNSCIGGTMIVRFHDEIEDGEFAANIDGIVNRVCETAVKFKNRVLTILALPKACERLQNTILERLGNITLVELYEELAFGEQIDEYLTNRARENSVRTDKNLFPAREEGQGFTPAELNTIFDIWYNNKLKTKLFPQYKDLESVKTKIKKRAPKGSSYNRLARLIGLDEAKKVINQSLNFYKAQKLFADKDIKHASPAMHMIFTGNPGSAKTTVARLFASILKENGILPRGELIEVGRADLVGKYVGHTAPLVKKAFNRAKGGVLFIDEAYSLVDDRDGMFGDEAINTIVQEMENNREDTVVIFAGYPDKMEGFLNKNPGLRSRIAFHVPFDDYSPDELVAIAESIAEENGLILTSDAKEKLGTACAAAVKQDGFGNGRYVRNLIEKARLNQASRLVNMDFAAVRDDDIFTLCSEDIEIPALKKDKKRAIGF